MMDMSQHLGRQFSCSLKKRMRLDELMGGGVEDRPSLRNFGEGRVRLGGSGPV